MITLIRIALLFLCTAGAFGEQSRVIERTIPVKPNQQIHLEGFHGSEVKMLSWDKPEIGIKITVSINAGSDEQEAEYLKGVAINETADPTSITVEFEKPKDIPTNSISGFIRGLFRGFQVSRQIIGEIYLPRNNPVASDMRYGIIALSGMKGTVSLNGVGNTITISDCAALESIENNYGKVKITKSGGTMTLVSRSSDEIVVEDFSGSAHLDVDYSIVSVKNIAKELKIRNVSGEVTVTDARSNVDINANYSTIDVHNVSGAVTINSRSSSRIQISAVLGLTVHAQYSTMSIHDVRVPAGSTIDIKNLSGSIEMEHAVGPVTIDADYTTISLLDIAGNVDLRTKSAEVTADSVRGNWRSVSEYSTVTLTALSSSSISVSNSSNPVLIECSKAPSMVSITNKYGSVDLKLPSGYAGEVALEATYGSIDTDFPLRTKSLGGGAYAAGKIGSGEGKIEIETTSGNISVHHAD